MRKFMMKYNSIIKYKKTPTGIMYILHIFSSNNLSYILFKCDHIFEGKNKNLDILFETSNNFRMARNILKKEGFNLILPQSVEKFKEMWVGMINGVLYSIHLHSEVSWHGLKALDKLPLFRRKRVINKYIVIPSLEDSVLIHAGHVLFENFVVTERERNYFKLWNEIDKNYIFKQVYRNGWKQGFIRIISSIEPLSSREISKFWLIKLLTEPIVLMYLTKKFFKKIIRFFSLKRKGLLISFIGVNGSGKSYTSKKLLNSMMQVTHHLGKKQFYYYYGWMATFPLTKLISNLNKLKLSNTLIGYIFPFNRIFFIIGNLFKNNFKENVTTNKFRRCNLWQEFSFLYQYFEYLYRYFKHIRKKLKLGNIVITDRYFYDLYGQCPQKSLILPKLLLLFPKPDITFLLDAPVENLMCRGKIDNSKQFISTIKRDIFPRKYLEIQRKNYLLLRNIFNIKIVDSTENIEGIINNLRDIIWKKIK
jgi:thymidylate kinase